MRDSRKAVLVAGNLGLVLISGTVSAADVDAEVAPFRLTGIEGHVELRFREDEQKSSSGGGTSFTETRTSFEEEIFLLTHSYFYHPNFLQMDLGIGPVFVQNELKTSAGSVKDDDSLYNLTARLRFLESKPYPVTLYYDRQNPSVSLSLTDRFQQESTKYGFIAQLRQPISPINFTVEASRQQTQGEGFDLKVDDTTEQATLRAYLPMGDDGYHQIVYNNTQLESRTGFIGQTIQQTNLDTDTTSYDSTLYFGEKRQIQFNNYISYTSQDSVRPLEEVRITPRLRWQHSDDLESFYTLGFQDSDQDTVQTQNKSASAGVRKQWAENLSMNAEARVENNQTTGLEVDSYGLSTSISYRHKLGWGTLNLSGGLNTQYFDRVVDTLVPVRDSLVTLSGTTPLELPQDFINTSSISIVRSSGGVPGAAVSTGFSCDGVTQVRIIEIGAKTQLQRCANAADLLPDPVDLFVSYEYDPGGTVAFTNLTQTYQANLDFLQFYNVYVRFHDTSASVRSGVPTLPLNETRNTVVGGRVDYPATDFVTVGGEVIYEEQESSITSFDRDSVDVYVQFPFWAGLMHLSSQVTNIDYTNSDEDSELTRYSLQYSARPWNRAVLTVNVYQEEDSGGSLKRETQYQSFNLSWRLRQLTVGAEARFVEEIQGSSERDRSSIRVTARREF